VNKLVVAMTGGIGSGKSSVAALFEALGVTVIDSDAISHGLTASGGTAMPSLIQAFGADIADERGALDRARMRELVFRDPEARRTLEAILHPMIGTEAERLRIESASPYLIRMIPLLVEGGDPHRRFARVLVVDCDEETQIARVMARSGLARGDVEAIMAAQASRAERLTHADDIIDNSGGLEALQPQVERLHRVYLDLARGA
jgi:dephospho-CoA kinase